jgi:cytochrome c-type biogenesis protein CcmH
MILWLIFAAMTAAAILAVLWPLGRPARTRGGSDLLVYEDQLQEIDRDRAAGLLGEAEAEAARIEVSRRLLAAAETETSTATAAAATSAAPTLGRRRAVMLAVLVILPLGPAGLYVALGSPNLPGQSAFARDMAPHGRESLATLVSQVEAHLARNPDDGRGWELLAPVYMRLNRFDDAVAARRKSLVLNGETAERRADLGEALVAAANGVVTADARGEFDRAMALDAHDAKARYFLGLAAEQDGNDEGAAVIWGSLLKDSPPNAPYVEFVRRALARVAGAGSQPKVNATALQENNNVSGAPASGPTAKDVAAAQPMSEDERRDMIRGMVARLADRLRHDGADVEGWLRLVRSYVVLGDLDKARAAAEDAKRALADRPDEIKRIDDLVKGLGLEG